MKSTISFTLIVCLAGSALPAAAQETAETTAGPLARAIARKALELAEAAAPTAASGLPQQSPPADADIWETVQALVPEIQEGDLEPAPAGIRAQAVAPDGELVDDFLIQEAERVVNVCNAPSPGATASLNIGKMIVERVAARLN